MSYYSSQDGLLMKFMLMVSQTIIFVRYVEFSLLLFTYTTIDNNEDIWKTKRVLDHLVLQALDSFKYMIGTSATKMTANFFRNLLLQLDTGITFYKYK